MTVLSVVQDVALKIGLEKPTEVLTSTSRDMEEMKSLLREVSSDILEAHDWQLLQTIYTLTGDASSSAFSMPSDYERMMVGSNLWSSRWTWEMSHITNADEWLEYQVLPYTFVNGYWMIYGGNINILPVMTATETAKFFYISNLVVSPASGSDTASFVNDTDSFRLDEHLLKLGLIWKWKEKKGQAYGEDMTSYESRKNYLMQKDRGSKSVLRGRSKYGRNVKTAFVQAVGG